MLWGFVPYDLVIFFDLEQLFDVRKREIFWLSRLIDVTITKGKIQKDDIGYNRPDSDRTLWRTTGPLIAIGQTADKKWSEIIGPDGPKSCRKVDGRASHEMSASSLELLIQNFQFSCYSKAICDYVL